MKPLEKYFTDVEKEYLALVQWLKNEVAKMPTGIQGLPPGERTVVESTTTIAEQVVTLAEGRRDEEEKEKLDWQKEVKRVKEPCPTCKRMDKSKVTGTTKNQTGHTIRKLRCKKCGTVYYDSIPIDFDEQIDWTRNFIEQMKKKRPEGISMMEKLNCSPEEVAEMEKRLEKMEEAGRKEREAIEAEKEGIAHMQKVLVNMSTVLANIKLRRQNFGSQQGMA